MTDFDLLIVSIGLNVCFLVYFYAQRVKIAIMTVALREVSYLMGHIADGKAMPKRDSKGEIRIKDLRNEEDKPSTSAV
jgi:hypothetical protein